MLTADIIARAVVASARSYGDNPIRALEAQRGILRRSIAPSAAALAAWSGASVRRISAILGVSAKNVSVAIRNPGFDAAYKAALAALGEKPPPSPVEAAPPVPPPLAGRGAGNLRELQMAAVEAYLRSVADKDDCVRGRTFHDISVGSGVAKGSISFAIQDLAQAKRIIVAKAFRPGTRAPAPNSYWLTPQPAGSPPKPPTPPTKPEKRAPDPVFSTAFEPRQRAPTASAAPPVRAQALSAARPIQAEDFELDEPPAKGPAILTSLRRGQCRWPLDDPGPGNGDRMLFCAAPSQGVYCCVHERAAAGRAHSKAPVTASELLRSVRRYV